MQCLICYSNNITTKLKIGSREIVKCNSCETEFEWPQPDNNEIVNFYTKNYYKSWGNHNPEAEKQVKALTARIKLDEILKIHTAGNLLDIGCAMAYFLTEASDAGFTPYGIEISEYSSGIAKKNISDKQIHHGKLEDEPFRSHTFDVITMFDLLEHVKDPIDNLKRAKKYLTEDGIIMITTPNLSSFSRLIMKKRWTHYKEEHLFYFRKYSIQLIAEKIGLELICIKKAKKALTIEYIYHQFQVYKHPVITPILNLLYKIIPSKFKKIPIYLAIGEMTVILKNIN